MVGNLGKTQYWARETMNKLYKATPDGYCGDEDNGQTSAWYVFSAMGFYPVTPASDQYVLGAPLFKQITLNLENGKTIVINAANNSHDNKFVSSLKVNGQLYSKNWLSHKALLNGAILNFDMTSAPNQQRGSSQNRPILFLYPVRNNEYNENPITPSAITTPKPGSLFHH